MDAAFADFLRVDVASGDASEDTIRNYRSEVELWVAWCIEQGFDPATVTVTHVKRYRQALIESNYNPVTVKMEALHRAPVLRRGTQRRTTPRQSRRRREGAARAPGYRGFQIPVR